MWHSHPWDTEFRLIKGKQVVGQGWDYGREFHGQGYALTKMSEAGKTSPHISTTGVSIAGDSYLMKAIDAWHYIIPIEGTSWSIMVNGPQLEVRERPAGFGESMSEEEVNSYRSQWLKLLQG
jgi:hypothetical protein